jgi:hypothetical protein
MAVSYRAQDNMRLDCVEMPETVDQDSDSIENMVRMLSLTNLPVYLYGSEEAGRQGDTSVWCRFQSNLSRCCPVCIG